MQPALCKSDNGFHVELHTWQCASKRWSLQGSIEIPGGDFVWAVGNACILIEVDLGDAHGTGSAAPMRVPVADGNVNEYVTACVRRTRPRAPALPAASAFSIQQGPWPMADAHAPVASLAAGETSSQSTRPTRTRATRSPCSTTTGSRRLHGRYAQPRSRCCSRCSG
jgi:hypothetical protein